MNVLNADDLVEREQLELPEANLADGLLSLAAMMLPLVSLIVNFCALCSHSTVAKPEVTWGTAHMMRTTPPGSAGPRANPQGDQRHEMPPASAGPAAPSAVDMGPTNQARAADSNSVARKSARQTALLKTLMSGHKRKDRDGVMQARVPTTVDQVQQQERKKAIHRKATPYSSKGGAPGIQLNCRVSVRPDPGPHALPRELVECRHLALLFSKTVGKKRLLLSQISTGQGIRESFQSRLSTLNAEFFELIARAPQSCKHALTSDGFGEYLQALAVTLAQQPETVGRLTQADCLLISSDHVMAIHMEQKRKDGVQYFVAKVYDPNDTANYKRVEQPNADGFKHLSLDDFLGSDVVEDYAALPGYPAQLVAVSLEHRLQPALPREVLPDPREHLHLALALGLTGDVDMVVSAAQRDEFGDSLVETLAAQSSASGIVGLHLAMSYGHASVVGLFADRVLNCETLTSRQQVELLCAYNNESTPAIHMALQEGQAAAVKAFAESVLGAQTLSGSQKYHLLQAKAADGVLGLSAALEQGHTSTVQAFVLAVLSARNLTEMQKRDLLDVKGPDGLSGLDMAVQFGHAETVEVFVKSVLNSEHLSRASKAHLLAPRLDN